MSKSSKHVHESVQGSVVSSKKGLDLRFGACDEWKASVLIIMLFDEPAERTTSGAARADAKTEQVLVECAGRSVCELQSKST